MPGHDGRIAVVTGAARGTSRSISRMLAERDRRGRPGRADRDARDARQSRSQATGIRADVPEPDQTRRLGEEVRIGPWKVHERGPEVTDCRRSHRRAFQRAAVLGVGGCAVPGRAGINLQDMGAGPHPAFGRSTPGSGPAHRDDAARRRRRLRTVRRSGRGVRARRDPRSRRAPAADQTGPGPTRTRTRDRARSRVTLALHRRRGVALRLRRARGRHPGGAQRTGPGRRAQRAAHLQRHRRQLPTPCRVRRRGRRRPAAAGPYCAATPSTVGAADRPSGRRCSTGEYASSCSTARCPPRRTSRGSCTTSPRSSPRVAGPDRSSTACTRPGSNAWTSANRGSRRSRSNVEPIVERNRVLRTPSLLTMNSSTCSDVRHGHRAGYDASSRNT
jgi:hypothetical protein